MQIGIPAETLAGETRVAATPETVKKFVAMGCKVVVQAGAGVVSTAPMKPLVPASLLVLLIH